MTKMRLISIFLLLLGSISLSLSSETDASKINWLGSAPDGTWTEEWFEAMPVDHYDLVNTDTFKMRYFINLHHYEEGGPIFFYCGNEGYIEFYIHATGQILEMAAEQKGAVVYAEHRFYGKTQPFGNESLSSAENLGYLTSMQALSDYALFIGHLKNTRIPGAKNSSVVAFGGSYGGMLATFFRAKYPHIVDMAVASCAPIYMFTDNGKSNNSYYYRDLTNIFVEAGCSKEAIYNSWGALRRLAKTAEGRAKLNQIFRLAKVSQIEIEGDIEILLGVFQQVLIDISMSDFPFETTAFNVMPAWPVNRSCEFFKDLKKSDEEYAEAMFQMVNLNKNWEGDRKEFCLKPGACPDDDKIGALKGWNWQICTEFVLPMCTQGLPNDFFENSCPFKSETNAESCTAVFKSIGYQPEMMSPHFTAVEYGLQLPTASRIIFTNGLRDPCINGGWSSTPKVEGSLVSLIVKDGSHMYDLCGSHVNDTESVKEVRKEIRRYLDKWLREMDGKPSTRGALSGLLPSFLLSLAVMLCIY
ncbi:hypothetical protein L596_023893 [Steinernema carpocapsae]|uniref:Uncharacterized protein n=1 Tax=Steinernema carpocapsae TaxID=34508 RepID=A0A4U5MF13_STECR|nr:hypothetical protein L596_023893 [Steinernema carpocapsae]